MAYRQSAQSIAARQMPRFPGGRRTVAGVCTRIAQRVLALTAAIWHNDRLGLRIRRSLTAFDH
mgnify:CR=1 FL=1